MRLTSFAQEALAAKEGKNLVVIGSSFISMEVIVALSKRKLASIHVIGMEEYPFEVVLGKEVGKGLKSVSVHLAAVVYLMDRSTTSRKGSCSTCLRKWKRL